MNPSKKQTEEHQTGSLSTNREMGGTRKKYADHAAVSKIGTAESKKIVRKNKRAKFGVGCGKQSRFSTNKYDYD